MVERAAGDVTGPLDLYVVFLSSNLGRRGCVAAFARDEKAAWVCAWLVLRVNGMRLVAER